MNTIVTSQRPTADGLTGARRLVLFLVAAACTLIPQPDAGASAPGQGSTDIQVREEQGTYRVGARFLVAESPAVVLAVLTDYEEIPRFMPDVRTSTVLERENGRAVVEQEAVARVMMFSKRVHLVLEVQEETGVIRFRDLCGKSFTRYEGSWQISPQDGGAAIVYQLNAQPSFEVPEFLLKRLLKRDAKLMIERLQTEIGARSQRTARR